MIIVTGATGVLGAQVVQRLLERVPAEQVGVSVRDPGAAGELAARGVRVRHGDFAQPGTLAAAFEGATQVLVVSVNAIGPDAIARHRAAIDAAKAAGARRILYTSHQAAAPDSVFAPAVDHDATEQHLAQSGVAWTSLRNGFYANTVPMLLGGALETGELLAPADGPVSWTTRGDLAAAAAAILTDEGRYDGATPPLTPPQAVDLNGVAGMLSELTGRAIRRVVVDDDAWVAGLVAQGTPEPAARLMLGLFHAAHRGEFAATAPDLESLIGHRATSLRSVLAAEVTRISA
jgi:NAD(P)H dehydrogenase (quinone)